MIVEINNRTKAAINLALIKRVVKLFCQEYKIKHQEISLAIVGDQEIKKLNQAYRRINQATDILTFAGEADFLGEIIIDYAQIKRQAKQFNNTALEELIFVLVHGLLHLIGYNDQTEKGRKEMERLTNKFVKLKLKY